MVANQEKLCDYIEDNFYNCSPKVHHRFTRIIFLESIVECLLATLFRKDNVLQNVYLEQIFGAYEMKHFTSLLEIKNCFTNKNLNLDVLLCPPFSESKKSGNICS